MSDTLKSIRLDMRISPDEKATYQRAADQDGRPLSNWIRDRLNRSARAELGEDGVKGKGRRPSP